MPLSIKGAEDIFLMLKNFINIIRIKYKLVIYKIRQDNDILIISAHSNILYKRWCENEGIEIELILIYTYEPNGGTKYIG